MKQSWKSWTDWEKFDGLDDLPTSPGAYVISASEPIKRIQDSDPNGILSIGETDNLQKRLKMFWRCANGEQHRGHTAGWRYRELDMQKLFPLKTLRFRWKEVPTKEAAYQLEGELLRAYAKQHFELPPLNYKYNWSDHHD